MANDIWVRTGVHLVTKVCLSPISPDHTLVVAEYFVAAHVSNVRNQALPAARNGCQSSEDTAHSGGQLGYALLGRS